MRSENIQILPRTGPREQPRQLFASFRQRLSDEAANDPEPELRFLPEWVLWQGRMWDRERRRVELIEAESLSVHRDDAAPLFEEGFAVFRDWCIRQEARRRLRRGAA